MISFCTGTWAPSNGWQAIENEGHPVFEVNLEKSVNQLMMDNYHAVPYMGQSKDDTIKGHLMNRAALNEQGIIYEG